MKASEFICEMIAAKAVITVLEQHREAYMEAYVRTLDIIDDLEMEAECMSEDFNEDFGPYDPELVYTWDPIKEFLVWECGLFWY